MPSLSKAIAHKGYKQPTPIQRKALPHLLDGRDVVGMARTGSGKTAAFLIPCIQRLKCHSAQVGARALILSPSRELAMQTKQFTQEFAKYTDLRCAVFVGGESMEEQFSMMVSNPDIIIATPGRFMHLLMEMNLDLKSIEYVVFDEADRLFEMGFAQQLREILFKLPSERQTVLFSATLPSSLVDFARAGLSNPVLIRLDVDTKISPDLQLLMFSVKPESKEAALLHLLIHVIPSDQQTIVFVATKHLVEYLHALLAEAGVEVAYLYGSLDPTARKINTSRFRHGKAKILIVTDVAARGVDIPMLDNVINYDFPGACKIFVHRVGRAARAGRKGTAYSLVTPDELPFLVDLQLFTGRPFVFGNVFEGSSGRAPAYTTELVYGHLPHSLLDVHEETVRKVNAEKIEVSALRKVAMNGYKLYYKTRGQAAKESYKRAKEILDCQVGTHPFFFDKEDEVEKNRARMLASVAQFRPAATIFEVGKKGTKTPESIVMAKRRSILTGKIELKSEEREKLASSMFKSQKEGLKRKLQEEPINTEGFDTEPVKKSKKTPDSFKDEEFYMPHVHPEANTERGYSMSSGQDFSSVVVSNATVDFIGDDADTLLQQSRKQVGQLTWNAKRKKFVRLAVGADNKKRIKTDSGALVPASFKTTRFKDWQSRTKTFMPRTGESELPSSGATYSNMGVKKYRHNKVTAPDPSSKNFARKQAQLEAKQRKSGVKIEQSSAKKPTVQRQVKSELKRPEQIQKQRRLKEQRRARSGGGKKPRKTRK